MSDQRRIESAIPRGIEVLVSKAAIDEDFRAFLFEDRLQAVASINLELSQAESMMLAAIPVKQLEMIIDRTIVPEEHRTAFLGKTAAVMLLAIGTMSLTSCFEPATKGALPDRPPVEKKDEKLKPTKGVRPDKPKTAEPIMDETGLDDPDKTKEPE